MIDTANQHANEYELTLLYQLLHAAPIVGAMLYEPRLNEAVRAWLNDLYDGAPSSRQRWLEILFLYYGLKTGDPMSYGEIAAEQGISKQSVRDKAARGLRYLWYQTRVETDPDPEHREELFHQALAANEWVTCDPRDTASLEFFLHVAVINGQISDRILTPKAPTEESTERRDAHRTGDPDLWHPEWYPTAPARRIPVDQYEAPGAPPVSLHSWVSTTPRQPRRPRRV